MFGQIHLPVTEIKLMYLRHLLVEGHLLGIDGKINISQLLVLRWVSECKGC